MKHSLLLIISLLSGFIFSQEQMAIWTFPSVSNAASNASFTPTTHQLNSAPTVTQYYQNIDDNGKGGVGYTDLQSVSQAASSAIAWDDLKGSGTDAELWFRLNTAGWTGLRMRFDYRSDSAEGFDIDYSSDNGASWTTIVFQTALTSGYVWSQKTLDLSAVTGINDRNSVIIRFATFDETGNDRIVFDNIEISGSRIVEAPGIPYIVSDAASSTRFANLDRYFTGSLSGTIADPTDPAATKGITFVLRDSDTPSGMLAVSVNSSNTSVVNGAGLVLNHLNDSVIRVFIQPSAVGYTDITVTAGDGVNTGTYTIKYAASAAAYDVGHTDFHTGIADASTCIEVGDNYVVTAGDETNNLVLYHKDSSGVYQNKFDVGIPMGLLAEADIEGSFRKDNKAYWIGSLGNSKSGNIRPDRHMFFSTTITGNGASTVLSYEGSYAMRDDVIAWGDSYGYDFTSSAADGEIPKQIDGFNVEGLALGPDSTSMYIGFRAPLVPATGPNARTRALICQVTNFENWFNNGAPAGSPSFGNPIELDLGGRSIRSMERNAAGQFLIIAGDYASGNFSTELFLWSGNPVDAPVQLTADLTDLNPEGIAYFPSPFFDGDSVELISDDGVRDWYNDATEAKSLPEENWRKFRSLKVQTQGGPPVCISTTSTTVVNNCGSYLWTDGNTYATSGNYTQTLMNAQGCDSVATLALTITQPSTSVTNVNACSSYQWTNGTTYTSSGNYTQTLTNAQGCDSVATLALTITQPSTSVTNVSACNSYQWTNGTTYTSSGNYTQTLTNAQGCDSVATLALTIAQPSTSVTNVSACSSYQWTNGTTYTTSGNYTQTLTNAQGCDSVATLALTITQPSTSVTNVSACSSYQWTNGTTYTTSGNYTQTLTNAQGCDSVATLALTITQPSTSVTNVSACSSYQWTNGTTYTTSGNYTQTLTNAQGCDSVATLALTIAQPATSTTTMTACDSYQWTDGNTYAVSGTYTQTLMSAAGCDSIATLDLIINPSEDTVLVIQALNSYTLNGTIYTTSGTYTQNLTTAAGCDSTVVLELSLNFTGIADIVQESITAYPNPGDGLYEIRGLEQLDAVSMWLIDSRGARVPFVREEQRIDIRDLEAGIYYLVIAHSSGHAQLKLLKY